MADSVKRNQRFFITGERPTEIGDIGIGLQWDKNYFRKYRTIHYPDDIDGTARKKLSSVETERAEMVGGADDPRKRIGTRPEMFGGGECNLCEGFVFK